LYIYNSDSIFSFSLFYRNKGLYRQIIDVNTEKSVRNSSHNSQMVNYPKGETPSARVRNDIDQDCQQTAPESASLDEQTKEDPETLEVGGPTSNSHEWNRSVSTVML
jgi:hypothetical protein